MKSQKLLTRPQLTTSSKQKAHKNVKKSSRFKTQGTKKSVVKKSARRSKKSPKNPLSFSEPNARLIFQKVMNTQRFADQRYSGVIEMESEKWNSNRLLYERSESKSPTPHDNIDF